VQVRVEGVTELGPGQARRFTFEREDQTQAGFILRVGSDLVAYHNRCPHWGVDLDMGEGRFYSALTDRIVCSTHGALFRTDTGFCDSGPCAGESLERFELHLDGDAAVVTIADVDPDPR
jgi:nitrite reductase/ring-hydroxylating ferredoxin subunit